jgi:TolA-binding protein
VAVTASAASVLKSFVVCVVIGAVGGGVMSLAASETIARLDQKPDSQAQPAPQAAVAPAQIRAPSAPDAVASAAPAVEAPAVVEAAPVAELSAKTAPSRSSGAGREEAAPSLPEPQTARAVPGSSLVEEQRVVESARAAVARGDLRAAAAALDNYDRSYPAKQFGPEALALRIEALRGAGQVSEARALAADFARRFPHHPLLQRVQGVVAR